MVDLDRLDKDLTAYVHGDRATWPVETGEVFALIAELRRLRERVHRQEVEITVTREALSKIRELTQSANIYRQVENILEVDNG